MTNVSAPGKVAVRRFLRLTAIKKLQEQGYKVERIPKAGKGSLRRITRGDESKIVTIRTSQDAWIAFPRNHTDTGWSTLEDADLVLAASLAEKGGTTANFHLMDADDIRARFDRARQARLDAHHVMPAERGIWISLYNEEAKDPVSMVGAGAGLKFQPFASNIPVIIEEERHDVEDEGDSEEDGADAQVVNSVPSAAPLTITEAKERLAATFGVSPSAIKITIEA